MIILGLGLQNLWSKKYGDGMGVEEEYSGYDTRNVDHEQIVGSVVQWFYTLIKETLTPLSQHRIGRKAKQSKSKI